jgi:hypothetical protein
MTKKLRSNACEPAIFDRVKVLFCVQHYCQAVAATRVLLSPSARDDHTLIMQPLALTE